jgi:hypothetical protein
MLRQGWGYPPGDPHITPHVCRFCSRILRFDADVQVGGARQLHVALAMAKGDRQRAFQARREARRAAELVGVPLAHLNIPTSPFASSPSTLPGGMYNALGVLQYWFLRYVRFCRRDVL